MLHSKLLAVKGGFLCTNVKFLLFSLHMILLLRVVRILVLETQMVFNSHEYPGHANTWTIWLFHIVQKFFQFLAQNKKPGNFFHLLQFNDGNCGVRLRYDPLSSELVEGKMVLKIVKPPRNKDSLSSLTAQSFSWIFNVSSPNSVKIKEFFLLLTYYVKSIDTFGGSWILQK